MQQYANIQGPESPRPHSPSAPSHVHCWPASRAASWTNPTTRRGTRGPGSRAHAGWSVREGEGGGEGGCLGGWSLLMKNGLASAYPCIKCLPSRFVSSIPLSNTGREDSVRARTTMLFCQEKESSQTPPRRSCLPPLAAQKPARCASRQPPPAAAM